MSLTAVTREMWTRVAGRAAGDFQLLALAVLEGPESHPSPNHQEHCPGPPGHGPSIRIPPPRDSG